MTFPLRRLAIGALLCTSCASGAADAPASTQPAAQAKLFDPARHMHTREVRPGMTGYGLSVFSGTKIERFEVEVISVLKNQMGPQHDIVLIRCHGQGLEHSGSVEGMSGSPIFLKDDQGHERMIGAFALGWEYSKDPIAGVRPIEEMLDVPADAPPAPASATASSEAALLSRSPTHWSARELVQSVDRREPSESASAKGGARLGGLGVPITVSGIDGAFFDRVARSIRREGFIAFQSGLSAKAPSDTADATLEPGAAIALPICTGDLEMLAVGTVTERIGDRIFAFGHEFNAEGAVNLPMGVGYIHAVIPASNISFKLGSLIRTEGAIHSDESVGIAGTVGATPPMIPVEVTVRTPQRNTEQTYHFQVVKHAKFTPMGITTAITSAVMGHSTLPTDFTVNYAMQMQFDGGQTVDMKDVATSATQASQLLRDLTLPLMLSLQNPFAKAYPTRVTATFEVTPEVVATTIKSAGTDKDIYKPGETARLFMTAETHKGNQSTTTFDFALPDDLDDGEYALTIGDANRSVTDETRYAPYQFDMRDIGDVFNLIRHETQSSSRQIYVRLASQQEGISVRRVPLKGLPASRVRMFNQPGRTEVMSFTQTFTKTYPYPEQVNGSADLKIIVSRTPEKIPRPTAQPAQPPSPPESPQKPPARLPSADEG